MTYMAHTNWTSIFGLSYLETMQLKYSEWLRMQDILKQKDFEALKKLEQSQPPPAAG